MWVYICTLFSVPQTHLPILTSIPNYLYNCSSTITWNQIVSSPTMFSFSKLLLAIAVLLSHQVLRWSIKTISHKPLFTYSDNAIRGKKKRGAGSSVSIFSHRTAWNEGQADACRWGKGLIAEAPREEQESLLCLRTPYKATDP